MRAAAAGARKGLQDPQKYNSLRLEFDAKSENHSMIAWEIGKWDSRVFVTNLVQVRRQLEATVGWGSPLLSQQDSDPFGTSQGCAPPVPGAPQRSCQCPPARQSATTNETHCASAVHSASHCAELFRPGT